MLAPIILFVLAINEPNALRFTRRFPRIMLIILSKCIFMLLLRHCEVYLMCVTSLMYLTRRVQCYVYFSFEFVVLLTALYGKMCIRVCAARMRHRQTEISIFSPLSTCVYVRDALKFPGTCV